METGAVVAIVIGGVLILAGIAWIFLAQTNILKDAETRLRTKGAVPADETTWPDVVKEFLKWLQKNIAKKLLPGFAMIIIGAAIIIATAFATSDGSSDGGSDESPAPTATTGTT